MPEMLQQTNNTTEKQRTMVDNSRQWKAYEINKQAEPKETEAAKIRMVNDHHFKTPFLFCMCSYPLPGRSNK
jgi:uncharacterized membrane protein